MRQGQFTFYSTIPVLASLYFCLPFSMSLIIPLTQILSLCCVIDVFGNLTDIMDAFSRKMHVPMNSLVKCIRR